MNYPISIAFGLMCLAFVAHMTGGIRESLTVRPSNGGDNSKNGSTHEQVERNWVQLMCAFQLVSVDLLVVAGILYLLAFTSFLQPSQQIAYAMSAFFAVWGVVWILQLVFLKRPMKDYLFLIPWAFWFLCSGLLFWGARAL